MANISGASLAQIQQRLRDTPAYHPFDADTFCDWAMEAGDIVTVRRGDESYQSPIHSSHLVWRGKQNMELNASGTKERDAIARVSKQKYARGGYGMRQQKSLYYEFYSEDGYLHSQFELNEERMRSEFEDVANSLRGEFEVTASHLRGEFEDVANGLRGEFEVTASHLRSEFNDTSNSLRGEFEVTASHLRGEFEDVANSLRGEFEVTASHLRGEFNDATNSLRGEFEVTASHLRGEFNDANNSLRGEFEVTAASLRAQFEDTSNSLRSSIEAEAGRIGLVVEGYGADASVKRASIVLAINNGKSSTHIDADEVYIGNKSSTTVINGKLNAEDVTADYIQGKIANLSTLQVNGITSSGSVSFSGTTTLSGTVQIQGSDGNTRNLATGIRTLYKASESEGVVTLQYIDFNGTTHDVSFSRAISSASWEWTNGMPKVTLSPQNQSFIGRQITHGTPYQDTQDNDRWKMEIQEIDTSTTPPRYVTIPGRTIGLYNYLEAKTGTAKITSNGTFTPGTGKIGFSSVEVDVDVTHKPNIAFDGEVTSEPSGYSELTSKTPSAGTTYYYKIQGTCSGGGDPVKKYIKITPSHSGSPNVAFDGEVTDVPSGYSELTSKTPSAGTTYYYKLQATCSGGGTPAKKYIKITPSHSGSPSVAYDGETTGSTAPSGYTELTSKTPSAGTTYYYKLQATCSGGGTPSKKYIKITPSHSGSPNIAYDGETTGSTAPSGYSELTSKTPSAGTTYYYKLQGTCSGGGTPTKKYIKITPSHSGSPSVAYDGVTTGSTAPSGYSELTSQSAAAGTTYYYKLQGKCSGGGDPAKKYIKVTTAADTNRWLNYSNSATSYQAYLTNGRYVGVFNSGSSTPEATWWVPNAWFYDRPKSGSGLYPSNVTRIDSLTSNDSYVWIEYHDPNGRLGSAVGNVAWHINVPVPTAGGEIRYGGVDTNKPNDHRLNDYAYEIGDQTLWFLFRSYNGANEVVDYKYYGVKNKFTSKSNCASGLTRAMVNGNLIHGVLYYKDGSQYKTITNNASYWYYTTSNTALSTMYS